jgi:ABC-type transport system involved in multi-copper enzyme maturation permease subunit
VYVLSLLILLSTAWLVLTGTQEVRNVGDTARFGSSLFQLLAPLQLAVAVFFSALTSASAVAQEKDRKTLVLLLLTNLTNSELVVGKLLASLLHVLVLVAASLPAFMLATLFGGISLGQVARVFVVTLVSVIACGSLGSIVALWREKTFQALAITVLVLVLWLAVWTVVDLGALGDAWWGIPHHDWAVAFSPWQAVWEASRPYFEEGGPSLGRVFGPIRGFLLVGAGISVLLNGVAIALVRVWNPPRETQKAAREDETWHRESIWGAEYDAPRAASTLAVPERQPLALAPCGAGGPIADRTHEEATGPMANRSCTKENRIYKKQKTLQTRPVWDNPVIWREVRTWAYGRKTLVIRLVYLVLFGMAAWEIYGMVSGAEPAAPADLGMVLGPLWLISLVLVNAQAVTSLTSERDAKALDLLLVSDITPKEFVFGKLGGVFFNTKEMVLLPMALCVYLWYMEAVSLENLVYLLLGSAVLYAFVAMLGIHAGMNYENSRSAIATSLGTVFFLFLGVATCMRIMLAFSGSFETQLQPFLAFMVGGGVGLYVALGARNPSTAIGVASFVCPVATFYALTSLLMNQTHLGFIAIAAAYGFTTVAMLIPAVDEFDVATGRTTIAEQ